MCIRALASDRSAVTRNSALIGIIKLGLFWGRPDATDADAAAAAAVVAAAHTPRMYGEVCMMMIVGGWSVGRSHGRSAVLG